MTRRLLLLNGLAILGVVIQHAAHTFPLPMFWWTFRYSPGTAVPNYEQFGSITYYALIAVIKLTFVSVPAFLFVSGYFVSFVARGNQASLSWKWVRVTVVRLLIPFVIWSLVTFFIEWVESCLDVCTTKSLGQYIIILITGRAQVPYWYVVLIVQFYLLSPFIVALAKTHLKLLLILTALAQICGIMFIYVGLFVDLPAILFDIFDGRLFPRDVIYFVFGIVAGFHITKLKLWLARFKWYLLVVLVITAILSVIEAEVIYRIIGGGYDYLNHIRGGWTTIPMTIYIFSAILCFLAFENVNYPFSKTFSQRLGPNSYGIYLLHPFFITFVPKAFYHLIPWILAYQILYQPALVAISVGVPLLFMSLVAKSRLHGAYRYLFG